MFSTASKRSLVTALMGAALASALIVSGASADTYQDLRSPDAVDAAREAGDAPSVAPPPSSVASSAEEAYQDMRSPDARDAAEGYAPTIDVEHVTDGSSAPSGFDWVSAAIGAAAGTGLLIMLLAAGGLARRRPLTSRPGAQGT
jgi:hypothetical protein